MDKLLVCLPDGYISRLTHISALIGEDLNDIIIGALEHEYILTDEQMQLLEKPLPF